MKKNKLLIYILCGIIPALIFFLCASINGYLPFGKYIYNIYDSFTQYPGILLNLKEGLLHGNLFYSWNGALGFNLFGTILYYGFSPLNLLMLIANEQNFFHVFATLIYIRLFLLGTSMCFYLQSKKTKFLHTILFSTIYALMGYTVTYYYNYMWIDSIIMLPIVIYGLDRLLDENKKLLYIATLTITICINFYIGYMMCIFSLLYFIYRVTEPKIDWEKVKNFIISSLLAGLISCIVLMPSYFTLINGKADLYKTSDLSGISNNAITFFYNLTSGEYVDGDQTYGPARIYTSIIVIPLVILFFANSKITKREKIRTASILAFYYLSFSLNALNLAWHLFQRPIWWQSRFSFTFSFFLILIALKSLENIDKVKLKNIPRMIISLIFIALTITGLLLKIKYGYQYKVYTYIYLFFSLLLFVEIIFLIDKKYCLPLILGFTFLDISLNTYNSLKQNNKKTEINNHASLRTNLPETLKTLNKENNDFYRMEQIYKYSANDGMFFNYHGLNYFSSTRNAQTLKTLENLGLTLEEDCDLILEKFDPVLMSLLNIKYLYGAIDYYKNLQNGLRENPYPLALGYTVNDSIKDVIIKSDIDYKENLNEIINAMYNEKIDIYKKIDYTNFVLNDAVLEDNTFKYTSSNANLTYEFTSDKDYILLTEDIWPNLSINDTNLETNTYRLIKKGDKVKLNYKLFENLDKDSVYLTLLDLEKYEKVMKKFSQNTLKVNTNTKNHLLGASIDITDEPSYLFTSIEYEKGMRVFVDNEEIKTDILLGSLIGFKLEKGSHTIVIDYVPKGLIPGLLLSVIGIISTCFYLQTSKKKL